MSKSANRKILTNSCPFRAIFKMKMGCLKQQRENWIKNHKALNYEESDTEIINLVKFVEWEKVFELHKLFNLHNHEMINYNTLQTVKHPLHSENEVAPA